MKFTKLSIWVLEPPIRSFMNYLCYHWVHTRHKVDSAKTEETDWIGKAKFKPAKSRSLMLKKAKIVGRFCFSIVGILI